MWSTGKQVPEHKYGSNLARRGTAAHPEFGHGQLESSLTLGQPEVGLKASTNQISRWEFNNSVPRGWNKDQDFSDELDGSDQSDEEGEDLLSEEDDDISSAAILESLTQATDKAIREWLEKKGDKVLQQAAEMIISAKIGQILAGTTRNVAELLGIPEYEKPEEKTEVVDLTQEEEF